jgi:error-prone DNA polymerase
MTRRDVLWAVRAFSESSLPLFDERPQVRDLEPAVRLPGLTLGEQVVDDYSTISMSLRTHPLALLRPMLSERRMSHSDALREARNGDRFSMAGLVLIRQRPGTASGVVFVTLEDEFGIANLVVWPKVFEAYRRTVMGARMLAAKGHVQREGIVIHLVVEQLWDWSAELDSIAALDGHFELRNGRGDQVRSSTPDPRDEPRPALTKPTPQQPYDRGRIHLDRPVIKIASPDFH